MKLYEIDQAISDCVDLETGEVIDAERLEQLQLERRDKIEAVACWRKNVLAEATAIKTERDVLAAREKRLLKLADSLDAWLERALDGNKFETARVSISFRSSSPVEIDDEKKFVDWAAGAERDDLLTYSTPTPNKTAIKRYLESGGTLDGVRIAQKKNMIVR